MSGRRHRHTTSPRAFAPSMLAALLLAQTASATDVDLKPVPPYILQGVHPNLILSIDNSGAMNNAYLPPDLHGGNPDRSLEWKDPPVDDEGNPTRYTRYATSADVNKLYYNPSLTYLPGLREDGTTLPHAEFNAADQLPYLGLNCEEVTTRPGWEALKPDPVDLSDEQYRALWRGADFCHGPEIAYIDTEGVEPYYHYFDKNITGCDGLNGELTKDECFVYVEVGSVADIDAANCAETSGYSASDRMNPPIQCTARVNDELIGGDVTADDHEGLAKRNFANWFVYYRTRFLATKTALSRVLQELHPSVRFTFQELDQDGDFLPDDTYYQTVLERYGAFDDAVRANFYDNLFSLEAWDQWPAALHGAVVRAGNLVTDAAMRRDDLNRDVTDPENFCGVKCRNNYHLIVSGGEMSFSQCVDGDDANCGNLNGPETVFSFPEPYADISYTSNGDETQNRLYRDGKENTLSDLTFYYWATDFDGDDDNNLVPPLDPTDASSKTGTYHEKRIADFWNPLIDPATWQHVTTFIVGLGSSGNVTPSSDYTDGYYTDYDARRVCVLVPGEDDDDPEREICSFETETCGSTDDPCTLREDGFPGDEWDYPTSDGNLSSIAPSIRVDDIWHAGLNGRGGYSSALDPSQLIDAFANVLATISANASDASSTPVAISAQSVDAGGLLFQTIIKTDRWSGEIYAYEISDGTATSPCDKPRGERCPNPHWEAHDELAKLDTDSRNIFTAGESDALIPFSYASWDALTEDQQEGLGGNAPTGGLDGYAEYRIAYLRGDSRCEESNLSSSSCGCKAAGCAFRDRDSTNKLGAIVNSAPVVVAPPRRLFTEHDYNAPTGFRFRSNIAGRDSMLYAGASDGMLHAFNVDDGVERFAYVPRLIYPRLTDLTDPDYLIAKEAMVDGQIAEADAYFDGAWHSIVVAGMGHGAQGLFALDVTYPTVSSDTTTGFSLLWEFSDHSENADRELDGRDLGYVYARPEVIRLDDDDDWVVLVPNGYNNTSTSGEEPDHCADNDTDAPTPCTISQSGDAALFVLNLDPEKPRIRAIMSTEEGTAEAASAGRGTLTNGLGPVTAIDTDGDLVADFAYAGDLFGNLWKFDLTNPDSLTSPTKLFQATINESGTPTQPITSAVAVARHPTGVGNLVLFGTGKWLGSNDTTDDDLQSFYGIWDDGGHVYTDRLVTRTKLFEQCFEEVASADGADDNSIGRVSTDRNDILWDGSTSGHRGWVIDLAITGRSGMTGCKDLEPENQEGERVISAPQIRSDRVVFVSVIPGDCCEGGGASWVNTLDLNDGSRLSDAPFDYDLSGGIGLEDLLESTVYDDSVAGSSIRLEPNDPSVYSTPALLLDGNTATNLISDSSGDLVQLRESSAMNWRVWRQIR